MEILRGTLREVVSMLPDDADIKAVVPVRYTVGSLDAIYDVVFTLPSEQELPAPRTSRSPSPRAPAPSTPRRKPAAHPSS